MDGVSLLVEASLFVAMTTLGVLAACWLAWVEHDRRKAFSVDPDGEGEDRDED